MVCRNFIDVEISRAIIVEGIKIRKNIVWEIFVFEICIRTLKLLNNDW
jgi:hypothetical protein